ncbi:uncharacterized protein LOC114616664 [Grammomys surdaster]|uniref:uncharacterized protein LOC114616664 n=1 Tax=Grammomys surdaster TaxID=491861 RepID=UPI0010A08443|nr:uncharacterized protein LOC114616664 [Grammomys surdaster]
MTRVAQGAHGPGLELIAAATSAGQRARPVSPEVLRRRHRGSDPGPSPKRSGGPAPSASPAPKATLTPYKVPSTSTSASSVLLQPRMHSGSAWCSRYSGPSFPRLTPSPSNVCAGTEKKKSLKLVGEERRLTGERRPELPQRHGKSPAKMSIGVPIKVLHEAEGHIVTCETNTGEVYRGKLIEAEDNMNCQVPSFAPGAVKERWRLSWGIRKVYLEVLMKLISPDSY